MRGIALGVLAVAVMAVSVRWGSFVAGGSDSYCYIHQAERWADVLRNPVSGRLQAVEPLALAAPWPDAASAFAPAGHLPSRTVPGALVPICPAGLSMLMAPLVVIGGAPAAFAVLPVFGALLVIAVAAVGARFGAPVGVASAFVTAASPVFLYQVVQPMSDVPAAALWLTAIAAATGTGARHAVWAGLASSLAILVRPNLVPFGFVIGAYLLLRPERTWSQRLQAAAAYAAACLPGCAAVALIQWAFYGTPFASGYGSLDALFGIENVWPNLQRYLPWLWESHTPLIALALAAPLLLPGPLSALFVTLFVVNLALYLPYVPFDDWSYLRFLLPTIPLVLVLVMAVIDAIARRWVRLRDTRLVLAMAAVIAAVPFVRAAEARNAFRLQALESRFERGGAYVRDHLPARALLITSSQSGSLRFYSGRKTIVWDGLDAASLEAALAFARAQGYEPYLLLERWEEPAFRERFASHPLGSLDWPPAAEIGGQVRVYRPEDRARYFAGRPFSTEYVR